MRKVFLLCTFMVNIAFMNAQTDDFICGTPTDPTPDIAGRHSYSIDSAVLATYDDVVHNIFFGALIEMMVRVLIQ